MSEKPKDVKPIIEQPQLQNPATPRTPGKAKVSDIDARQTSRAKLIFPGPLPFLAKEDSKTICKGGTHILYMVYTHWGGVLGKSLSFKYPICALYTKYWFQGFSIGLRNYTHATSMNSYYYHMELLRIHQCTFPSDSLAERLYGVSKSYIQFHGAKVYNICVPPLQIVFESSFARNGNGPGKINLARDNDEAYPQFGIQPPKLPHAPGAMEWSFGEMSPGSLTSNQKLEEDAEQADSVPLLKAAPIHALGRPIRLMSTNKHVPLSKETVKFLGCYPFGQRQRRYDISDEDYADRIDTAISLGFNNPDEPIVRVPYTRKLTRSDRKEFKEELSMLNKMLTEVIMYENTNGEGYSINKEFRTRPSAHLTRFGRLELPVWGVDGNTSNFWKANDLELLAICYRADVENFLTIIIDSGNRFEEIKGKIMTTKLSKLPARPGTTLPLSTMLEESARDLPPRTRFLNQNPSFFSDPTRQNNSKKLRELFPEEERPNAYGTSASNIGNLVTGEEGKGYPRKIGNGKGRKERKGNVNDDEDRESAKGKRVVPDLQFDHKLKVDAIPAWDGNTDTIVRWISKVNRLSAQSTTIHKQLGALVPTRLKGSAETWYYSLSLPVRSLYEQNWANLRNGIAAYYMNRAFIEKQKLRANKAKYREAEHSKETPSEYFIRKVELLDFAYNYSEPQMITEIMNGAPTFWTSVLTPHLYDSLVEFQQTLKFHEEHLLEQETMSRNDFRRPPASRNPFRYPYKEAKVNLIGASDKLPPPQYPKDDTNVSRKQTPESKGARPCRHCGSGKHWDPECKYSRKAKRMARANLVSVDDEDIQANEEYEELYYGLETDDEDSSQDF
ncbi:hypothetical protein BKA70DRAFT_1414957 [Coprinopsis sp. MPI-PUGE-AT-0042]|nr:hypothetical protein BKA70DRAFT_1414957 [Coprinopsis sp. MPI-PUGE-AT-0042]